ncbi:hypothetical protein [Falsirhodobacter halotolerans]|uniref:hypothetical protein n=1 Tax=Falsirhodobacter halotolerans TaxID=1146892 RepID=UPI001FD024FE|nr:hypothetical protein [Falsirhodobacter halotolerans]MCJ8140468.1 hypothetical protein [Falsirhodobacter halotolerans]
MHDDLDDLFARARHRTQAPSADLMARILADADAARARPAPPAPRRPWWRVFGLMAGGAGAMAGLASAALAGVWIGFAQPEALGLITGNLVTGAVLDPYPAFDAVLEEMRP